MHGKMPWRFLGRTFGVFWSHFGSHLGLTWVSLGSHLGLTWLGAFFCSAYSPTCRPFFFTCFSRSLSFGPVFTFVLFLVPFGLNLACFLECLGTLETELPCGREHDSHTLDFLFSGLISRPDFAADFFQTFRIFVHFGAPLRRPFGCPCPFRLGQVQTKVTQSSFTLYSPFIHPLFTLYSPFIHHLFTIYSPFIQHLFSHHSVIIQNISNVSYGFLWNSSLYFEIGPNKGIR